MTRGQVGKSASPLPWALAIAVILVVIVFALRTPPCRGGWKFRLGGDHYLLWDCDGGGDGDGDGGAGCKEMPAHEPLFRDVKLSNDAVRVLGGPGTKTDTSFIGYVKATRRPGMRVTFGYVHKDHTSTIQSSDSAPAGECARFHFDPSTGGGADVAAQIENASTGDEATISVWRVE